jgi:carbamoyltransferase
VALNCVANGRILKEGPFENLWIQPAAGDAGGALGASLSVWHRFLDKGRSVTPGKDAQQGSYLGPRYSSEQIKAFLDKKGYPYRMLAHEERAGAIAAHIAKGRIVGYLCGRMEFGPRALGARSILGDPRQVETQSVMNLKIKYRESFRPFAPTVLEGKAQEYFDLDRPSPYMLLVAKIHEKRRFPQPSPDGLGIRERLKVKRSDIPAVTHLDYSARIQTVSQELKPDYHRVIEEFERMTGCAVLVNTSFNVRGEPIICTPEDAYRCFMRTEMDVLVLEDIILLKEEQPQWEENREWHDELILD